MSIPIDQLRIYLIVPQEKAACLIDSQIKKGKDLLDKARSIEGRVQASRIEGRYENWRSSIIRLVGPQLFGSTSLQNEFRRLRLEEKPIDIVLQARRDIPKQLLSVRERRYYLLERLSQDLDRLRSLHEQVEQGIFSVVQPAQPAPCDVEAATDAEHVSASERYVFRKSGEVWEIAYEGPAFHLPDVKGLACIAWLLRNPGREFHVLDLVAAVEKNLPGDDAALYGKMTREQLAGEGLSVSHGAEGDDLLDKQARKEFEERLQEIGEERELARQVGDDEEEARLDEEVEWIERELRRSEGLGRRQRKLGSSPEDKARVSIQKLIKRARTQIQGLDRALFEHLSSSITTGYYCAYKPKTSIPWSL